MRDILAKSNTRTLSRFTASKVALVFDYDGTLAPIVDDPACACVRAETRELLGRLTKAYPCAVISGRAWEDVSKLLHGTGVEPIVGSHGADWGFLPIRGATIVARVHALAARLRRLLEPVSGVFVEDKAYSIAVHYRRAADKGSAIAQIARALGTVRGAHIARGKEVVNIVPEGLPDKALALEKVRKLLGCETAVYVGDDTNDEGVFRLQQEHLLGIRVEPSRQSAARYFISDQPAIDELLRALLRLRPAERASRACA